METLPEIVPAANQAADATKQKLLQAVETFEYSKCTRQVLLDVDAAAVIEAAALVGHNIRVYWREEDAWYLGTVTSYNRETGEHHVDYVDGDQLDHIMALERVRILITQGAELPKPSAAAMNDYCTLLEQRAARIQSTEHEDAAELIRRAAELRAGTSVGAPDSENRCSSYRPGDVVWAKCRSFPPWPAMVVTRQLVSSLYRKLPAGKYLNSYAIVYFGSFEYEWRDEKDLTSMREGITRDFHIGKTIKRRLFSAAICEATAYMADGEIPEMMFPCNDEVESDGEEEEEEEQTRRKKKGTSSKEGKDKLSEKENYWQRVGIETGPPVLSVGKTLTIFSLGRVEWLHPSFHDEKSIWPVGYTAERVAVTPASGSKKPSRHLCEILEASDGSGPIFRITPWGKPAVEGRTPHKAWMALFETPESVNGTALVIGNGAKQFGLTVPQVSSAIMALPGSNRCERFAGWLDGETPDPLPPLNTEEERKRLAHEAAACRLPEGVVGIPTALTTPGTCYVCFEEEEDEEDLVLQCDGCGIFTHMSCYGVPEPPHGHLWLCDTCKVGAAFPPSCVVCPIIGGALKRTECGRWAHPSCVMWLPEDAFLDRSLSYHTLQGLVTGLSSIHPSRRRLTCQICKMPHGACMQCCEPGCYAAFHIMCARQTEGYALQLLADSDSEEEDEEDEEEEAAVGDDGEKEDGMALIGTILEGGKSIIEDDIAGMPSTSGSGDENGQAVANGAAPTDLTAATTDMNTVETKPLTKKRGRPAAPPGTKKPKKKLKYKMVRGKRRAIITEGTKINGARLMVYCPKHCPDDYIQHRIIPAAVLQPIAVVEGNASGGSHLDYKNGQKQTITAPQGGAVRALLPSTAAAAAAAGGVTVDGVLARNEGDGVSDGRCSAAGVSSTLLLSTLTHKTGTAISINAAAATVGIGKTETANLLNNKKFIDEALLEKASAAVAGWPAPPTTKKTSTTPSHHAARAMPFDGSLGRGPRAPEAMEAALAKRYYIEATPLLVRGPVPGLIDPPKSTCTWHINNNNSTSLASLLHNGGAGGLGGSLGGDGAGDGSCTLQVHSAGFDTTTHPHGNGINNISNIHNAKTMMCPVGNIVGPLNSKVVPSLVPSLLVGSTISPKVMEPERMNVNLPLPLAGVCEEDEDIEIMGKEEEDTDRNRIKIGIDGGNTCIINTGDAIDSSTEAADGGVGVVVVPLKEPVLPDAVEDEDIISKPIPATTTTTSTTTPVVKTAIAPQIALDRKIVLSSSERYREMRATESLRIAPGKSAIHGWGAFARLPHTKDQMVIEYVGDLVRPSVADARERQVYDSLVGAGTYVFRVNMDQCVDATQSGNLAHLLNHSCEPNCYSRTVPVWEADKGGAVDHVVIFAAREIAAWEELTYDYRFSGEERLVCNCGAGRCRGVVNQASSGPGGGVAMRGTLVPKSKVKYPFRNT